MDMEDTKTKQPTVIKPKFSFGDIVYLITDPEQRERMVTAYFIRENSIRYYLAFGESESHHSEIEIAEAKDWTKV